MKLSLEAVTVLSSALGSRGSEDDQAPKAEVPAPSKAPSASRIKVADTPYTARGAASAAREARRDLVRGRRPGARPIHVAAFALTDLPLPPFDPT